jgi:hypothetical protein
MPNPEETSKVGAGTKDVALETAGPYSGEIEREIAKEALGDGAADRPLRQGSLGSKGEADTQGENPKRTSNSHPG